MTPFMPVTRPRTTQPRNRD